MLQEKTDGKSDLDEQIFRRTVEDAGPYNSTINSNLLVDHHMKQFIEPIGFSRQIQSAEEGLQTG